MTSVMVYTHTTHPPTHTHTGQNHFPPSLPLFTVSYALTDLSPTRRSYPLYKHLPGVNRTLESDSLIKMLNELNKVNYFTLELTHCNVTRFIRKLYCTKWRTAVGEM